MPIAPEGPGRGIVEIVIDPYSVGGDWQKLAKAATTSGILPTKRNIGKRTQMRFKE